MSKQNRVPASILSAFALTAILLLAVVINVEAGAPLHGVDVKMGSNPGGNAAARTATDSSGHFSFPAQPAGSYTITMERPSDAGDAAITISVKGAAGGAITKTFNPPAAASAARAAAAPVKVDLKSDGKTPITGIIETTAGKTHSTATKS